MSKDNPTLKDGYQSSLIQISAPVTNEPELQVLSINLTRQINAALAEIQDRINKLLGPDELIVTVDAGVKLRFVKGVLRDDNYTT